MKLKQFMGIKEKGQDKSIDYNFISYSTTENIDITTTHVVPYQPFNFASKYDQLKLYNQGVSKPTLVYLLKAYSEADTTQILRVKDNVEFDKSIPLLKSQIQYEINNRDLKHACDFIIKRHNYIDVLKNNKLLISFLFAYCQTRADLSHELMKLLALKYYLKIGI
jgi:hypothetical protein